MNPRPERGNTRPVLRWLRAEALPLLVMLLLLTAARSSFANHYHVPSGSMQPTLMPGDRVVVDMTAYGLRLPFTDIDVVERATPRPGEVVVFDSPVDGTRLIKRVVAVGGDRVDVIDGRLWIDGERSQLHRRAEPTEAFGERIAHLDLSDGGGRDVHGLVVPEGQVLVMGDHRGASFDGRYFGLVPQSEFYGRAVAVYWRSGEAFVWQPL
ncbi:signal peptidase I [Lysobacter arseniciresistens ZS79]|uniref:Signal peptidase I n=1 Tax=Lysobacter arseniciresistens ZS79 TaxID=913325 RepID=A0A0A0F1F7_9GAMM|nr:signal peptidase I [Lysobacter arseniciresistens]KGM56629.1 signal peptidase I [Lysobacter arseniciresistens ZS79]